MPNYYIEQDNKIVLFDTNLKKIEATMSFMPQLKNFKIQKTERPIEFDQTTNNYIFADTAEFLEQKLNDLKKEKLAQINTTKESAFKEGVVFKNAHFDCDDRAQDRTGNRLTLLQAQPVESLEWLDYNYQPITLSMDEFQELCKAIFERVQFIEFKTGKLIEEIKRCTNAKDLAKININFNESEE